MPPKRRAPSPSRPPSAKQARLDPTNITSSISHPPPVDNPPVSSDDTFQQQWDAIKTRFYPPEMTNERCEAYNAGKIPRPIELLNQALASTKKDRQAIETGKCVVHWFKRDLRSRDNRGLSVAGQKALKEDVPLIGLFVVSEEDYQAHLTSAMRVDFELRSLDVLKGDLAELDIPLVVLECAKRKEVVDMVLGKCEEWGAKHLFSNMEYEVDELRRETKLVKIGVKRGVSVEVLHDDVVVPPGDLQSGSGKQYSVYSPWYRAWVKHIHANPKLLEECPSPSKNPPSTREDLSALFDLPIPPAPESKILSRDAKLHFTSLYPPGQTSAHTRLDKFLATRIKDYKTARNLPAANSTSHLSVHFSAGTLSTRTAIRLAQAANSSKSLDAGNLGITTWISELAWRDFYKHVLAHWPYVCMAKPFKYEYSDIPWDYSPALFKAWTDGRTGYPIVDAAMRQLTSTAYVHNRCRMVVASFLAKDLLLDWRLGEAYFMSNLIDADFASNNGGWGFSASTGVDPQPYFRIFNPLLQSEKFDPDGEYVRKWVPELRDVVGKAVHDPWGRCKGAELRKLEKSGYPRPVVVHKEARERALERYKSGLGRSTANKGGGVHN